MKTTVKGKAPEIMMARKLIPYSRFSGKRQEAGRSQERQDEMVERAAVEEGVEIDRSIRLNDKGMSGFRGANWKRGDLGKFLDLVDAGVVPQNSILCIERVNRLSRMPWMDQVELWKEILARGIVIRTCEPVARYTKENMNDLGIGCPVVLYMMLGHLESKQKSEWCNDAFGAMKASARNDGSPHGFSCPGWIEKVQVSHPKDAERLVTVGYRLNQERVALLQWAHDRAQEGWGYIRIWKALEERKEPAWGRCKRWSRSLVSFMLSTRTSLGEYQPTKLDEKGNRIPEGPPILDQYPAAISEECWHRTQVALRSRRRKGGRQSPVVSSLFTHLVRDADTGKPLFYLKRSKKEQERRKGGIYNYLFLESSKQSWRVPYEAFERGVLFILVQLRACNVDGRKDEDLLNSRLESLQRKRSELGMDLDALGQQLDELPSSKWPKRAVARMAELEEAIMETDEELRVVAEAANSSTRTQALSDLHSVLARLDKSKNTPEEIPLRRRLKARIPFVVESIWLKLQSETKLSRYFHVKVYLRGGEERYFWLPFGRPKSPPWNLADEDFRLRSGEESHPASDSSSLPEPDCIVVGS